MALKIIDHGSKEYAQMLALRNDVLRKPLGLHFTEKEIKDEKDNIHIAAFEDDVLLGCCMLVKNTSKVVILRQMAVKNDLQGKGIGRALMDFAELISRDLGYKEISMHARSSSAGFYEKLGYKTSGNEFIKLSIPHILMQKRIAH